MENFYEEYEPTDEELREMEELIKEAEEEERYITSEEIRRNRIFYVYADFFAFCRWLKDNGIKWENGET